MQDFDGDFQIIYDYINQKVRGLHIHEIRVLTKRDLLFVFSETKSFFLSCSLEPQQPLLAIIEAPFDYTPLNRIDNIVLKQHIFKMKIDEINRINEDVIIEFCGHKKADNYELRQYRLIFELIKNHPNMLLLCDNRLIWANRYFALDQTRPIIVGMEYNPPTKPHKQVTRDFVKKTQMYEQYLLDKVLHEKVAPLESIARKRLKQLMSKVTNLTEDLKKWNDQQVLKEVADYILTYLEPHRHQDSIEYLGHNYILDPALTLFDNAKQLYKRYRKAKLAQQPIEQQLSIAKKEIDKLNTLLDRDYGKTFFGIESLENELISLNLIKKLSKNTKKLDVNQKHPYTIVSNSISYSFGRNAIQNDHLTFNIASKDDTFFHVKNYPGAHVICHHPDPNMSMIVTAASIALLLSRLNSGEVSYTKVAYLKKGKQTGQVLMKKHNSIHIQTIDPYLDQLIKNAKRRL